MFDSTRPRGVIAATSRVKYISTRGVTAGSGSPFSSGASFTSSLAPISTDAVMSSSRSARKGRFSSTQKSNRPARRLRPIASSSTSLNWTTSARPSRRSDTNARCCAIPTSVSGALTTDLPTAVDGSGALA